MRAIGCVALVVRDYDEAIAYYTERLRFELIEDTPVGGGKRWVRVAPSGTGGTALLLAKAATPEQLTRLGDQTGGRVFLFLHTDDFQRDYDEMGSRGVVFEEEPRQEAYGTVAVFRDLYGNRWDWCSQVRPRQRMRVEIRLSDPWEMGEALGWPAMPGTVACAIGADWLVEIERPFVHAGEEYQFLVVSPRHDAKTLDSATSEEVPCAMIRTTPDRASSESPCDVSWWRGGHAMIGSIRVLAPE